MSIVKSMDFRATPIRETTPKGVMVISAMPSHRIVGYLMYRHRVGLLALCAVLSMGYMVWDKVGRLFF